MEKPQTFVREATGLVRDITVFDSVGLGIAALGIMSIFFFYSSYITSFPNDNPFIAIAVIALPVIIVMTTWALLAMAFPRSGGDYVFNTRSLHPTIGIMTDLLVVSGVPLSFPFFAIGSIQLFSDLFKLEGLETGSTGLTGVGNFLLEPNVEFVITTALLLITIFFLIGRVRSYFHAQSIFNLLGIIAVLVFAVLLLATSNSSYQTQFASLFGTSYSSIIQSAQTSGFTLPSWGTYPSIVGVSFLIFYLPLAWPTYVAGEMQKPQRTLFVALVATEIFAVLLFLFVGFAALRTMGVNFTYAATYLANSGKSPIPTETFLLDFGAPVMGGPVGIAIFFILISVGSFFTGTLSLVATSRKLFAWSFDRLIPATFSDVSPRFRTPVATAILIFFIAEIFTVVFVYGPGIYAIATGLGVILSAIFLGVASLSAIVLPFRKSMFERTPAVVQKKIGPVPVLLILGVISFISMMSLLVFGQIIPAIQGGVNPDQAAVTFGIFFLGLPFYYVAKWYRRRVNHIDLSLAYRDIPPE